MIGRRWLQVAALSVSLAASLACAAGLPAAYQAVVIEPTGGPDRAEFDLSAVQRRAASEHKRLYVYLGASDCRFCRRYEAFLDKNAAELAPRFAERYLVVDLRSALMMTSNKVFFKAGDKALNYTEFQKSIGDERARMLVYPNVWLLDSALKPLTQMPSGTGTFETVEEQIEVLQDVP